jgi:hypothetical protein
MAKVGTKALIERLDAPAANTIPFDRLPFTVADATAGSEDELQAVVVGSSQDCDLPISICESRFFRNIARRSASGEGPRHTLQEVEAYLKDTLGVWENSWIRFPQRRLSQRAQQLLEADFQVVRDGQATERSDASRFRFLRNGELWVRIPISYALKLALADLTGSQPHMPEPMRVEAERLMKHFLNDNTSPETTSFQIVDATDGRSLGENVARESARRFLFTSLLVAWANLRFGLLEHGQRAMVYHAPVPSVHQEDLSSCISDSFYRELFMSPCLSGWSDGEKKHEYMHLCHQVLSRSQLNAVGKLREAGIIAMDLVILPSLSNISLANNGIHVSIGSRMLTDGQHWNLDSEGAKNVGDLAIKIFEHFLALFVGIYTAAPYRIGFSQFHPERLLSFLPHELDFTHLRLLWREWKEKAQLRIFGHPLTPYGPRRLDNMVSRVFRLRGDCVPDARLLTYPVAWLATAQASALDGTVGNVSRLSSELDELGIVDRRMSFYMPLRLREGLSDGYSGFEARYYSLFPSYDKDMQPAADLQQFLLALACRMALLGEVEHGEIPDDPTLESERRQPFFFAAAGLPAFYVHRDSHNQFLKTILRKCKTTRPSRRHPKYHRVSIRDYRRALLTHIRENAADLVEAMGMEGVLTDLAVRCEDQEQQAEHRLAGGILSGTADPMRVEAREFNRAAEKFYREQLRRQNLGEAFSHLRQDAEALQRSERSEIRACLRHGVRVQEVGRFLDDVEQRTLSDQLSLQEVTTLLNLVLVLALEERRRSARGKS